MRQPPSENQPLQQFSHTNRLKTRVDVDGTLIIPGKLGHLYEYDKHALAVVVVPPMPRKNYWGITRKKLAKLGFTIIQDGDGEGAAVFDHSKPEQSKAAIGAARIYRKRRVSPSQIDRQITWLRSAAGRSL